MLFFFLFIAFLARAHNFAEYINTTTVFLHSKYSMLRLYEKKTLKVCFLKFIEPERLSPYQLMVCSQKPKATRQSPHYFTQYFQVMSRILKFKMLPFQHFQAYEWTGHWLMTCTRNHTKSDIFHLFYFVSFHRRRMIHARVSC